METKLTDKSVERLLLALPPFIEIHGERCWLTVSATISPNEWNAGYQAGKTGLFPVPYFSVGDTPFKALEELLLTLNTIKTFAW